MAKKKRSQPRIDAFNLEEGRIIAGKYELLSRLGRGWEGEVYLLRERATGIERAAKMFYPQRNKGQRASRSYAKKLHKLRHHHILIQYHGQEEMVIQGIKVPLLISEYVDGEILTQFLARQPGGRLTPFQALHMLHELCVGIEGIHLAGEYHGDLHTENVIVQRFGLGFELKLLDLFLWDGSKREAMQDDVVGLVEVFYEVLGGKRTYAKQPAIVKSICCGLRRPLILKKFKRASHLRAFIETLEWY